MREELYKQIDEAVKDELKAAEQVTIADTKVMRFFWKSSRN